MTNRSQIVYELNSTADYFHSVSRTLRTPLGSRLAQAVVLLMRASEEIERFDKAETAAKSCTEEIPVTVPPTPPRSQAAHVPKRSQFGKETT